jgi:hypothetical protein
MGQRRAEQNRTEQMGGTDLEMVRRVWLYEGDTKRVIMILVAVLRLIYMLPKRQFGFGVFGGGEQDLRSQKCNQTHKKKHPPCFREVQSQSSGSSKENSPMPVSRSYINKCVKAGYPPYAAQNCRVASTNAKAATLQKIRSSQ